MNPLNNKPFTEKYEKIKERWSTLPANKKENQDKMEKLLNKYSLILLTGETGSGKTTQIPKMVLKYLNYEKNVVCTQPRKLASEKVAERVADELDVKLGDEVGFQYRGKSKISKNTKLRFITDGILMMQMFDKESATQYGAIIIDEAHERSIRIDIILYFLRERLKKQMKDPKKYPDIKIIIMSATIDLDLFRNYFKDIPFGELSISGRTYPVSSYYLTKTPSRDYLSLIENVIVSICNPSGKDITDIYSYSPPLRDSNDDILVFLPNITDITNLYKNLDINPLMPEHVAVFRLFSGVNVKEKDLAISPDLYKKGTNFRRKVVLATNIAETSVTINGVVYVIDSGLVINKRYEPKIRADKISKEYASQSSIKQRIGRAGRTQSGISYHIYTKQQFSKFRKYENPDIEFEDFTETYLNFLSILKTTDKVNKVLKGLIQPPEPAFINTSIERLEELKALKKDEITILGETLSKIPANPSISIMMLVGRHYNCYYEMITLGSMMTVSTDVTKWFVIKRDKSGRPIIPPIWKDMSHKYGDHLTFLKIFSTYLKIGKKKDGSREKNLYELRKKWCLDNGVKLNKLLELSKNFRQYKRILDKIDVEKIGMKFIQSGGSKQVYISQKTSENVIKCILYGFFSQIACYKKGQLVTRHFKLPVKTRDTNLKSNKNCIVYTELTIIGNNKFVNVISSTVNNKWLKEIAPEYSKKFLNDI